MRYGKVILWIPAFLMIGVAAAFAIWMISEHWGDNIFFAKACANIALMLSPVLVFAISGRLKVVKGVNTFGGGFKVFVSTALCTVAFVAITVIANLKGLAPAQLDAWKIYSYYMLIAFGEEVYYRLVLCVGVLALMSCKHKAIGVIGTALVTATGLVGSVQASIDTRMTWIGVSIVIFAGFYIIAGRKDKDSPAWAVVAAVAISAVAFGMAHYVVYAAEPHLIWAMGIGGGVLAAFLIATKNPFVPFTAHVINNLFALRGIVVN